jgi:polar amino acid transport system substrate-binding protein
MAAIGGSVAEKWMNERAKTLQLTSDLTTVEGYDAGVQAVADRTVDAFFGQMPVLLDQATRSESSGSLVVLPRHFTYEPQALALARGDEDFRLLVDTALSTAYRADGFLDRVKTWFGAPDKSLVTFFQQTALPE